MDQDYSETMLKARMAETLFEEMMRASGNTIYRFGYEAILQNLTQLREKFDKYTDVGKKIRSLPDFVVLDKEGKPMFVEVKYRWNAQAHAADKERFEAISDLWGATIVIVSCLEKPFFSRCTPALFCRGQQPAPRPAPLCNRV